MPTNNFKVGEMLNKRSPNSKTWINFDGSYTTEIHQGVIHFEDYEGNLHNIDTSLFDEADLFDYDGPIEKHGKDLLNEARERSRADKKANKLNRDSYDFQGLKVPFLAKLPRNFKRGYKIGYGENRLHFKPVGASPSKGYVDEERGNCIHYQDAWNDADVCLELTDKGIKETIVLKTDRAPFKFSFEVNGTLEDDLTAGAMALQPAWLEDANGEKRDVSQTIRRVGEQTFIDLEADVNGLVYPIYIDPTVNVQPNPTNGIDAYINEGNPAQNNGTDTNMFVGLTSGSSLRYRSLIKFDISYIPIGASITSSSVYLYQSGSYDTSGQTLNFYRITADWNETAVTWNNQPTFDNTNVYAQMTTGASSTFYSTLSANLNNLISGWVNGTFPNYGMMIAHSNEAVQGTYKSFWTSDYTTLTTNRPKLQINYNLPPTTPTVTLPNGGETLNSSYTVTWTGSKDYETPFTAFPYDNSFALQLSSSTTKIAQSFTNTTAGTLKTFSFFASSVPASTNARISLCSVNGQSPFTELSVVASFAVVNGRNDVPFNYALSASTDYFLVVEYVNNIFSINFGLVMPNSAGYTRYLSSGTWTTASGGPWCFEAKVELNTSLQYHIQLSTNNGSTWKDIVALTSAGATSYTYDFINEAQTSTGLIRIRAYDGSAYSPYDQSNGVFTIQHNQAPTAPTNLNPSSGVKDQAVVNRLSWTHNDPNGDIQSKFDLQYRLQGAGSWTTVTQTTPNNYYDFSAWGLPLGVIEWQVRTYDQAGLSGPYSSIATFSVATKPATPTITSPTNGATVSIANPVIQWSHPTQTDYDLIIKDSTGTTTIWQDTKTSTNKAVTVGANLANGTSYKVQVAVKDSGGLWSNFASNDITVSYTPPAIPILTSVEDNIRGSIAITINNPTPTGSQPTVTGCDLYRQEGTGAFVCIKKGINGSYTDYTVKPNTTISYYVIANGSNGTVSQSATITDSAGVSLTQLALLSDNTKYVTLTLGTKLSENRKVERALMQFAGRKYAVAEFGEQKENGYSYSYVIKTQSELDTLESILDAQETILLRDTKGRKAFVTLEGISINELATYWEITLNPTQVEYNEGV
jgi:hypothetical protein